MSAAGWVCAQWRWWTYHLAGTGGFTDTVHLNDLYHNLIHCPGFQPEFRLDFKAKRNSAAAKWPKDAKVAGLCRFECLGDVPVVTFCTTRSEAGTNFGRDSTNVTPLERFTFEGLTTCRDLALRGEDACDARRDFWRVRRLLASRR